MSNSLLTYAYIRGKRCSHAFVHSGIYNIDHLLYVSSLHTEHPEMAALLFTSSVCVGLLLTLLAVSVRVTCRDHRPLAPTSRSQTVNCQVEDDGGDDDDDEEGTESSLISAAERKEMYGWEEVTYMSEAAERAERIERREMIIQEIWMNAYLNGSSC